MPSIDKMIKFSPNWYWKKLGYTILRVKNYRTIYNKNKAIICFDVGHTLECKIANILLFGMVNNVKIDQ